MCINHIYPLKITSLIYFVTYFIFSDITDIVTNMAACKYKYVCLISC